MNCIFCDIVGRVAHGDIVYEDADTLAFLTTHPHSKGHALVIPKEHSENIHTISEQALAAVAHTTQKVARAVKRAAQADGINIAINNEKAAGQIIFHTHVHVIPRFEGDTQTHDHTPHLRYVYANDEAALVAQNIRTALE